MCVLSVGAKAESWRDGMKEPETEPGVVAINSPVLVRRKGDFWEFQNVSVRQSVK